MAKPDFPCPVCGHVTPPLPAFSETWIVTYYRCDQCRHIWTVSTDEQKLINHVTPLTSTPKSWHSK